MSISFFFFCFPFLSRWPSVRPFFCLILVVSSILWSVGRPVSQSFYLPAFLPSLLPFFPHSLLSLPSLSLSPSPSPSPSLSLYFCRLFVCWLFFWIRSFYSLTCPCESLKVMMKIVCSEWWDVTTPSVIYFTHKYMQICSHTYTHTAFFPPSLPPSLPHTHPRSLSLSLSLSLTHSTNLTVLSLTPRLWPGRRSTHLVRPTAFLLSTQTNYVYKTHTLNTCGYT